VTRDEIQLAAENAQGFRDGFRAGYGAGLDDGMGIGWDKLRFRLINSAPEGEFEAPLAWMSFLRGDVPSNGDGEEG